MKNSKMLNRDFSWLEKKKQTIYLTLPAFQVEVYAQAFDFLTTKLTQIKYLHVHVQKVIHDAYAKQRVNIIFGDIIFKT